MTTATLPIQPSFLKKNLFLGVTVSTVLIIVIMAFSFGLHMVNIESIGDANARYTYDGGIELTTLFSHQSTR